MTILQRYLAAIGVISPPGSKGSSSKYPSLGSGYPNSNSGMFFTTTSTAAAAAAAAAAKAASRKRGTSAPAPGHSPSASHMGYEEYDRSELAHAYSEADFHQAYAAYQAYQEHTLAAAAAAAAQEAAEVEGEDEVAEGAVDGLLQLAHAAMLHLEEMDGTGEEEYDEEEGEEGTGSGSGEAQHCTRHDEEMCDAAAEAYGDNEHQHTHTDEQHMKAGSGHQAEVAPAGSKAGSKSPAGRHLPAWMKQEMAMSVMSSEESDRTAEEPDEGSPLAEQLLRQHLKPGSKRGSPSTATLARNGQPASSTAPSKRPRSIWGAAEDAPAAVAAAAAAAGSGAPGARCGRLVLDVSEPEGASSCVPPSLSLPVGPASPAIPSVASTTAPMSDLNAHLVAMLMGAFMGAADSTAASSPAAALPPDALAAIARVMATSMSSLQASAGQQQQQQHASTDALPAQHPASLPATHLAAHGEA
jgi:hypothetical protein